MAVGQTRNLRNGKLTLRDGKTPTANSLIAVLAQGNLSFTVRDSTFMVLERGVIDHHVQGDQEGVEVSWSMKFQTLSNTTTGASGPPTVYDFVKKTGDAATFVSTTTCGPYTIDLLFDIASPCTGAKTERITFPNFHANELVFNEADEFNTLQISGRCLSLMPTVTYL